MWLKHALLSVFFVMMLASIGKLKAQPVDTTMVQKAIDSLNSWYNAGDYKTILKMSNLWIEQANAIKYPRGLGTIYNIVGNSHLRLGNYEAALKAAIAAEQNHQQANHFKGVFSAALLKANIYFATKDLAAAKNAYQQSYTIANNIGYLKGKGKAALNLGMLYNEVKQSDSALYFLNKASSAFKEENDLANLNGVYSNMGVIYYDKQAYPTALIYYQKALVNAQTLNDKLSEMLLSINVASTHNKLGNYYDAINTVQYAITIAKKEGMLNEQQIGLAILADAYASLKNYKKAFVALSEATILKDSINIVAQTEAVATITNAYEAALKDKSIEALQKEKQIQAVAYQSKINENRNKLIIAVVAVFLILLVAIGLYFYIQQRQQKQLATIEKERIQAELNALKVQLNPHVLFNSLNTIYFQMDDDIAIAKATILKYADLLRYQLYQTNESYVPLSGEITFLEKFIDIQRLRISERCIIDVSLDKSLGNCLIAPLLLINLVENAFKYATNIKGQDNFIIVKLYGSTQKIILETSNTTLVESKGNTYEGGIGLSNLSKRLQLIYPNKHELEINRNENIFTVRLAIDLTI